MSSKFQPKKIGLKLRRDGLQPSIFVRTFSPITNNGRVEWEAAAQRRADREKARTAATASQEVRVRLQEEIEEAKKQRRRITKEREKARQFDRQREEIHPPHVLEALAAMQESPPSSLRLPEATPDPDGEYPVHVLPIRPHEKKTNL